MDLDGLIGTPFEYGGRGPDTYDCWGLVLELLKRDGLDPPSYTSVKDKAVIASMMANATTLYEKLDKPEPGHVVLFRAGRHACHVGYVLPYEKFIHTWEKSGGVCIEPLENWKHRIVGYYKYVGFKRS